MASVKVLGPIWKLLNIFAKPSVELTDVADSHWSCHADQQHSSVEVQCPRLVDSDSEDDGAQGADRLEQQSKQQREVNKGQRSVHVDCRLAHLAPRAVH